MLPPDAIPRSIPLAPREASDYGHLVDTLVDATIRERLRFRDHDRGLVDPTQWRAVKEAAQVRIYKDRRAKRASCQRLLGPDGRFEPVLSNVSMPQWLVVGSLPGTIEDVLYGGFVDSSEAHRLRAAYIKDQSSDFHFVSTVRSPTDRDPLAFAGIAWCELADVGIPFVWRRDLLVLIAQGIRKTASGERFGYYVIHSVSRHELRPLTEYKFMRAKCSFCYLYRQTDAETLEIFQKGFFAPMGDISERSVLSSVVKNLLTPTRLMDAALGKKLNYMMNHPPARKRSFAFSETCAAGCRAKFGTMSNKHGVCIICRLPMCSSCKVTHKIAVAATRTHVTQKALSFCSVCVQHALQTSGMAFARAELLDQWPAEDVAAEPAPSFPRVLLDLDLASSFTASDASSHRNSSHSGSSSRSGCGGVAGPSEPVPEPVAPAIPTKHGLLL